MKKLNFRVERKKEIQKLYKAHLKNLNEISFFEQDLVNTTPWFIDILAENKTGLQKFLKEKGIGTRDMYPPINKQKAYNIDGNFPVSDLIGLKGLWLPSASKLSNENIEYISQNICEFYS